MPVKPKPGQEEQAERLASQANDLCLRINPYGELEAEDLLDEYGGVNDALCAICDRGEPILGYRRLREALGEG